MLSLIIAPDDITIGFDVHIIIVIIFNFVSCLSNVQSISYKVSEMSVLYNVNKELCNYFIEIIPKHHSTILNSNTEFSKTNVSHSSRDQILYLSFATTYVYTKRDI